MGRRNLRLLGALFAVALIAAACGAEATTETAAAEPVTEAINASSTEADVSAEEATPDESPDEAMENEALEDGPSHDDEGDSHSHDEGAVLEVNADAPIPLVDIALTETDDPGLFDLAVTLTNFTITPDNLDGDPVDNEGHLHLYLDGERVGRFFDVDYQVEIPEGEHLVEVELSSNSHLAYALDGEPIRASATVVGTGAAVDIEDSHSHEGGSVEEGLEAVAADHAIAATFVSGSVALDTDDRLEASVGDVVMISVDSDVVEEIHLHGYDIFADVSPDETTTMLFTADTPGRFEVEFETSGVFIVELVVS